MSVKASISDCNDQTLPEFVAARDGDANGQFGLVRRCLHATLRSPRIRSVVARIVEAGHRVSWILKEFANPVALKSRGVFCWTGRFAPVAGGSGVRGEKGVRYILCTAPEGPFRQNVPDPFFAAACRRWSRS